MVKNSHIDNDEKNALMQVLQEELKLIHVFSSHHFQKDSIKGESGLRLSNDGYQGQAPDILTFKGTSILFLSEIKYAVKLGGMGPFRNSKTFCEKISDKFLDAQKFLQDAGESFSKSRIIVTNNEQYPFFKALIAATFNNMSTEDATSFSQDGHQYQYILCSSSGLAKLIYDAEAPTDQEDSIFRFVL